MKGSLKSHIKFLGSEVLPPSLPENLKSRQLIAHIYSQDLFFFIEGVGLSMNYSILKKKRQTLATNLDICVFRFIVRIGLFFGMEGLFVIALVRITTLIRFPLQHYNLHVFRTNLTIVLSRAINLWNSFLQRRPQARFIPYKQI